MKTVCVLYVKVCGVCGERGKGRIHTANADCGNAHSSACSRVSGVDTCNMADLSALTPLTAAELRLRLPELFVAIDGADEATAPLVASLVSKAFDGPEGLAILRDEGNLPFKLRGLGHNDSQVRALTLAQLARLASSATDVEMLVKCGVTPLVAAAVGDSVLHVSQRAAAFFVECSKAGPAPLAAVLGDAPTLNALRQLGSDGGRHASVLQLRTLAVFAELAGTGDGQFAVVARCELLEPAVALWRGGDPLVQLNAVELFGVLARAPAGVAWLEQCEVLAELEAVVRVAVGEDPMTDLLRPAVVGCLATLLEVGGARAAGLLLGQLQLVASLWPLLAARETEQHCAALAALRAAAASPAGMSAILSAASAESSGGGSSTLGALLRAHDERARVGALSVTAQLVATHAAQAAAAGVNGAVGGEQASAMDVDATAPTGAHEVAVRSLVDSCSSSSTSAADVIATAANSLSDEVRTAGLRLLHALATLEWGALQVRSLRLDPPGLDPPGLGPPGPRTTRPSTAKRPLP